MGLEPLGPDAQFALNPLGNFLYLIRKNCCFPKRRKKTRRRTRAS